MKYHLIKLTLFAVVTLIPTPARGHCDALDGPVVKAGQKALEQGDVNLALIWVRKADEAELKQAFERTLTVRKLDAKAKELADLYFFETLVRIHRAGEGAAYTGLKPAGRDLGPAIAAGDEALNSERVEPLVKFLREEMERGLRRHLEETLTKQKFEKNDVKAGRAFVKAYVEYIHYVEALHKAAVKPAHGHFPEADEKSVQGHLNHQEE